MLIHAHNVRPGDLIGDPITLVSFVQVFVTHNRIPFAPGQVSTNYALGTVLVLNAQGGRVMLDAMDAVQLAGKLFDPTGVPG